MENISNSSSVQADRREKKYLSASLLRAFILFLFFLIFAIFAIAYGILKRLPYIPEDIADVVLESLVYESCPEQNCNYTGSLELNNFGWAKYQYPKYGFSIEIPNTSEFNSEFVDSEDSRYVWSIYSYDSSVPALEEFPRDFKNYENRIVVKYLPIQMPITYTDWDIFEGSVLYIDFFERENTLNTIEDIETEFLKNITSRQQVLNFQDLNYTKKEISLDGKKGFEYEYSTEIYREMGTIVLTDEYIVQINRSMIHSQGDTFKQVELVLESMEFN